MQNENQSFIDVIIETCIELEGTFESYCREHDCSQCDFSANNNICRYKTDLLLLLTGYHMATTNHTEKAQIDDFLKDNYPSFLVKLNKQI